MKKLIPADTVDSEGTVWETIGENIRRGSKEYTENSIKAIVDIIFPVGSVYCGENSFILSVGKWDQITNNSGRSIALGASAQTGSNITVTVGGDSTVTQTAMRMWKRVS